MDAPRVPLYDRLPEIYRTRDQQLEPPGQLQSFLALVEDIFGAIHADVESLYADLFVETAADWAVPYIGDLLGTSHLAGDPWTIRADVADTIALRRRKGTLAAIELLTFNLTRWGVRAVELRDNLAWFQHLNHQRPDAGGRPPLAPPGPGHAAAMRGGTVTLRDPALLSFIGTPFDPFAHLPDVKPHTDAAIGYNLPNLAIFLWRLAAFRIAIARPGPTANQPIAGAAAGEAAVVVRVEVDPLDRPVRLFNVRRDDAVKRLDPTQAIALTETDQAPGPILPAGLTDDTPAGNPAAYVAVETYDLLAVPPDPPEILDVGLQLHLPGPQFAGDVWQFRGANLCAWEAGLDRPLANREVAIDPVIGRLLVGVATVAEANVVRNGLLLTYTYGAAGPVGAHPISRLDPPREWNGEPFDRRAVSIAAAASLGNALANLDVAPRPLLIEIEDSLVHDLDLATVAGTVIEAGGPNLLLNRTVIIRATSGNRPIIRLARPLRARPARVVAANPVDQPALDAANAQLTLRLEGLFLVRGPGFPGNAPLIARAALNSLELDGCTLDPGGFHRRDGTRAPIETAIALRLGHGFAQAAEAAAFRETPAIRLRRAIAGPILLDQDYTLDLRDTIVDAGRGVADPPGNVVAVGNASDPVNGWGAPTTVGGATFFGRVRVETIDGRGGVWVHALEAHNNQTGCIKFSYLCGVGDRLPQNHACVHGPTARLAFTDEAFGDPAYGQLAAATDFRIRERGPNDDQMGAFGFLFEAHKWRNLAIRYREFMPLGVRPLLIPVT